MKHRTIRLGTRSSALATWQANWVAAQLRQHKIDVDIVFLSTQGDQQTQSLSQMGGVGVFTKEIQRALLENEVDLAVHSLKDLPTESVKGLSLAAVPQRESIHDALVGRHDQTLDNLPHGAVIGTGSMRRRAQLLSMRPDLQIRDIRGNVDTRLAKLDGGEYDGIILAEAGLKRLGFEDRVTEIIPTSKMLPAIGQGALGLEIRSDDQETAQSVMPINDEKTHSAVLVERTFLAAIQAGCLAPVAGWARWQDNSLKFDALVLSLDGRQRLESSNEASVAEMDIVGHAAANDLLARGAADLIAAARE